MTPITRRSFLGSILALASAPAIMRAEYLMPVRAPLLRVSLPYLVGYSAYYWTDEKTKVALGWGDRIIVPHSGTILVETARPMFNTITVEARSEYDLRRKLAEVRARVRQSPSP